MPQEVHLVDASWPIPLGVTEVTVQLKGGGGSGVNTVPGGTSGGGGGGEYGKQVINVTAGNNLGLIVGAIGGSSQVSGANNAGMIFVEAKGGGGASGQMGGVGGSGGTGTLLHSGGAGGNGGTTMMGPMGGGGGGAAGGFDGTGAVGGSASGGSGGAGGAAPTTEFSPAIIAGNPGGAGGAGGASGVAGTTGDLYGGGGGGGGGASAGVGRHGVIVIDYAAADGSIGLDPQGPSTYFTGPGCLAGVTSTTWPHKVLTGNNRHLLVGVSIASSAVTTTAVTYGGVALTKIVEITNGSVRSELWGLVNPSVGIADVVVTFSGQSFGEGTSASFSGVDQTTPIEATASRIDTASSTSSLNITTVTDRAVVIDYITCPSSISGQGASQVLIVKNDCFAGNGMSRKGPISPAGTTAMSWTWGGSGASAHVAVALRPTGVGGNWWPFFD